MAKYIDAEALVAKFRAEADKLEGWEGDTLAGLSLADTIATEMPAADVEPVVHARWVPKAEMVRSIYARNFSCSHCGHEPLETNIHCPHCGAKMDEEATHD